MGSAAKEEKIKKKETQKNTTRHRQSDRNKREKRTETKTETDRHAIWLEEREREIRIKNFLRFSLPLALLLQSYSVVMSAVSSSSFSFSNCPSFLQPV